MILDQSKSTKYYDGRSMNMGGIFPMRVALEWSGWATDKNTTDYIVGAPELQRCVIRNSTENSSYIQVL